MNKEADILAARDAVATIDLKRIGGAIGYGNAQDILGKAWDDVLLAAYGMPPVRGKMGVTVKDERLHAEIERMRAALERPADGWTLNLLLAAVDKAMGKL